MTPHSTDRAAAISPLDMFAASSPSSATEGPASRAFETVLNHATERPEKKSEARTEHLPKNERTRDAHKTMKPAAAGHSHRPQRNAVDEEPVDADKVAEEKIDESAKNRANDSCPVCPPPHDLPIDHEEEREAESQVGEEANQKLVGDGYPPLPFVAIANELIGEWVEPTPAIEPPLVSEIGPVNAGVPVDNQPAGNANEVGDSGEVDLLPAEVVAIQENGALSLAEAGSELPPTADPILVTEAPAAALGRSPADSQPSSGETSDDSSRQDEQPQEGAEATPLLDSNTGSLANPEPQSGAAAPVSPSDVTSHPREAPQPPGPVLQPAVGAEQSFPRLPQHLIARSEAQRHNPALMPVDSARFISRVAKAFAVAQHRDGEIRLRLSPPELGSLRLQVSVQDGVMTARLETETEAARTSLVNNLPVLRERLAEQGIRVERFDIDLMQHPSTGTPDRPNDPQQYPDPQLQHVSRTGRPLDAEPMVLPASGNSWNGQGRLNVII